VHEAVASPTRVDLGSGLGGTAQPVRPTNLRGRLGGLFCGLKFNKMSIRGGETKKVGKQGQKKNGHNPRTRWHEVKTFVKHVK